MTREELIKKQIEYCDLNNAPYFAENHLHPGFCIYCGRDIVEEKWAVDLITGCPICHKSFCD